MPAKMIVLVPVRETPVEAHARGAHPHNDWLSCPACERERMAKLIAGN